VAPRRQATQDRPRGETTKLRSYPYRGGDMKCPDGPHASITDARLANLRAAPRCGAKTRQGLACRAAALRGKRRCRLHGGRSTGPITPHGVERCRFAAWKHGDYSAEARLARAEVRGLVRVSMELISQIDHLNSGSDCYSSPGHS